MRPRPPIRTLVAALLAWVALGDRAVAGDCYAVLDDQPKVIFYLSNSHKGSTGLQRHLDHAGYDHIKVEQNLFGFLMKLDAETGEWSSRSPHREILEQWKKDYPDRPAIIVYQNNEANIKLPKDREDWPAARAEMKDWAAPTDGAYFALMRKKLKAEGFSELYILNHHASRVSMSPQVDHPRWLETIKEYNQLTGCELGVDAWETTKPYYPRTVGADYWHNNEFGRLAKTWPLMRAFARNSGVKDYKAIDLDRALEEYEAQHLHVSDVRPAGKGQAYAAGDTVDITWRMVDADLHPTVDVYLEVAEGVYKYRLAEGVPSAREHYRWTIPAEAEAVHIHNDKRTTPIFDERCRLRVTWPGAKHHKVSGISPGYFQVAQQRPDAAPAPAPADPPPAIGDNARQVGDVTVRIARFPGYYRGALAIVIRDDGGAALVTSLEEFAGREHPDLVTVVVDPRRAGTDAARWKAIDALGHEIAFEHGRVGGEELRSVFDTLELQHTRRPMTVTADPQAESADLVIDGEPRDYRALPDDLGVLRSYHIKAGSVDAVRAVMDRVIDRRSLAVVTFGDRGEDFDAQIAALHERQDVMWNGSLDRLRRHLRQARAVTVTIEQFDRDAVKLTLTDDLPDAIYDQPLEVQIPVPHWQWSDAACTQGETERWCEVIRRPEGGRGDNVIRFRAVPDAGSVMIRPN